MFEGARSLHLQCLSNPKQTLKQTVVIYAQSNEIHNVVALIKFLLVLRFQLYMFQTVTVHPQELLVDTVYADYGTW